MKSKSTNKKGQFSIIAALLTVTIMVGAVIMTYATIRNLPFSEPPKVLSSLEELNLSLKQLLEFSIGYYGSVMQVTGNVSYAKGLTLNYLQSGLVHIAHSHPEWNPSFEIKPNSLDFSTRWYEITSYSIGNLSITYSMPSLGMSKITYNTSATLNVGILDTVNGKSKVLVTREGNKPDLSLGKGNFFFYKYSDSTWNLINPSTEPIVFSNGTYMLQIPSGVDQSSYLIKVSDSKGIMAIAFFSASRQPRYTYTFTWNSTLYSSLTKDTIVVEALQNGTLRWLGQNLKFSTSAKPIIPIPVRILHVNQTINGINREVPFQVEDWGSNYRVPLGLTSNASLFGDRQMIVFLVNHNVQRVTLWWDGRDTAKQTSYAWKNRYFTGDDPSQRKLTNGNLTITISSDYKTITSSVTGGSITSTASFMRINSRNPTYGSGPAYVIYKGIVRDIVQQEAEWSGGILKSASPPATENCPNVYSQIYLTLPANATYYTYATRLIFINSTQSRTIKDLSAIQLSVSDVSLSPRTENGTSGGYPINSTATGLFYNRTSPSFQTGWAHHWSEFISGSSGAGIMFTDSANQKLYVFDNIAGQKTGALNVMTSPNRVIEFNPLARSQYPASFTYPLDVTWHGAVVTFNNDPNNTIYPTSGNIGLWVIVEYPPRILMATNDVFITVTSSPSGSGYVRVDGNAITTPATFNWTIGSTHALQALSLVSGGTGIQYVYTGWSDGGAQNHIYTAPHSDAIVTANYKTQYQVTFAQTGLDSSATGTVVTIGGVTKTRSQLPYTDWFDSGTTYSYSSPVSGDSGKQFVLTGVTGPASPITASGTVTGSYKTQYQVSFAVSPSGRGTTTPSGTNVWEDAGVISISATANPGYAFSSWSATGSITIANPSSASTTATISGLGTITATFSRIPLGLDGSASANSGGGSSITMNLTTTNPNDLIYISVVESSSQTVSSITSNPSLIWTRRASVPYSSSRHLETWYAVRSLSGSISITITLSGSTNAAAVAFGVSGADTASPFDGDAVSNSGSGTSASVTKSTSNANDFIIGALGVEGNPSLTPWTGFTLIRTQTASSSRETSDEYRLLSATGSYSVGYSWSGSQSWAMIADAIKQAP
jgi:hypothetical protein